MSNPLDMLPPLVEDWPFPLFLIEPEDETILWANQAAQEWLEKSMRKIVGQTPWDLVSIVEEEASVISKCRELNARDDVEGEEGQSLIELIGSEIDRIRRLADRMETLGDQDPDNVDRVNIHEILRRARQVIQSANPNLIFTERYDPSLPHAKGDADTLMQALLNLIKNAAEAVEPLNGQGEIILQTRFRSGVTSHTGSDDTTQHLPIEICIIDNGPGIAKHIASQLFQPFVSTKPEGQGLGLSLVSKVAAAHGGLVEVKSRPGKTKFSLLLTDGETL